jgi:hypothetical protein
MSLIELFEVDIELKIKIDKWLTEIKQRRQQKKTTVALQSELNSRKE